MITVVAFYVQEKHVLLMTSVLRVPYRCE